jgi:photosystem II stability/assembly factor-like uncharacterized protein
MNTGNSGYNWYLPDHEKAERLNDACSPDYIHAWTVGIKDNMNYILYSENSGDTWVQQTGPFVQGAELFSVSFRDALSGSACGAAGAFYVTNNGGDSWALDINIPSLGVDMNDVFNWGMQTGCAVGGDGTALVTTNKWGNYVETTTNTNEDLHGVAVDPVTSKMWAVGTNGTIIFTSNYLLGWISQSTGTTEDLADIDMIDEENGWAVGDNGTILRFGPNTGINDPLTQNSKLKIQNYPNPTAGIFNLQFTIYSLQSVSVAIIDVYGREVAMVLDEEMLAGEHVVHYDMSGLPDGVYFIELRAKDVGQRAVEKVVKTN